MSVLEQVNILIENELFDQALSLLDDELMLRAGSELLFCKANILLLLENYGEVLRTLNGIDEFELGKKIELESNILRSLAYAKMNRDRDAKHYFKLATDQLIDNPEEMAVIDGNLFFNLLMSIEQFADN